MYVEFFVPGIPAPGGSKKAFIPKGWKRPVIVEDCKRNADWRSVVSLAASTAMNGKPLFAGPVSIQAKFLVPRPKNHYKSNGSIRPNAPTYPIVKPDTLKLTRSTEDALKGIVWTDDSQVCEMYLRKLYVAPGNECGVRILIRGI